MRLCAIDLETNGLSFDTSSITEVGYVIKDFGAPKPLVMRSFLIRPDPMPEGFISEEITQITGITAEHLQRAGGPFAKAMTTLAADMAEFMGDAFVGHNCHNFDLPMLLANCQREPGLGEISEWLSKMTWLDTQHDIVYPKHWQKNLVGVAANLGFLNPFPHAALFDAYTCLKVLEHFDLDAIVQRNKTPWIVVRALDITPPYRQEHLAEDEKDASICKKHRYAWQNCGDGKTYPKAWVKRVKADEFDAEVATVPFKIAKVS